jgi:hypothetical protein
MAMPAGAPLNVSAARPAPPQQQRVLSARVTALVSLGCGGVRVQLAATSAPSRGPPSHTVRHCKKPITHARTLPHAARKRTRSLPAWLWRPRVRHAVRRPRRRSVVRPARAPCGVPLHALQPGSARLQLCRPWRRPRLICACRCRPGRRRRRPRVPVRAVANLGHSVVAAVCGRGVSARRRRCARHRHASGGSTGAGGHA